MEGSEATQSDLIVNLAGRTIPKVRRSKCIIDRKSDRIGIGRRGKLGGPGDGINGIVDYNGHTADDIIERAKAQYRDVYKKNYGVEFIDGKKTYPSDTWFRYVEDRRPVLFIYLIDISVTDDESNQRKQIDEFRNSMNGIPALGLAMGLPHNDKADPKSVIKYKTNKVGRFPDQEEIATEGEEI